MTRRFLFTIAAVLAAVCLSAQSHEGLITYTLDNGLTVMLWEDKDAPDVTGYVAVRAGSLDEPEEYTGLAHYLEHMLFKGTQRIGALDWEKEKPLYERIIALYDRYAETTDPAERAALAKQINEASMAAAEVSTTEDMFLLLDGMGATDVNAFTSYDMTCYHNSFPAEQMLRWLTLYSDRLTDPVFRTFQAELEKVFEEYNMYEDGMNTQQSNRLMEEVYKGHPYERNVIGKAEHLKNPRLSRLIEFYNTWYVPNNMALILVGNFNTERTVPMIASTFGRLQPKELPERKAYPDTDYKGNPKKTFRIGYRPSVVWAYKGVKVNDKDLLPLQLVVNLLNNSSRTGLLDKLNMDGDVSSVHAYMDARRDAGRLMISAIPYYDPNQRSYSSNGATEKTVMNQVNRLVKGDIPDWLVQSAKDAYIRDFDLAFEDYEAKVSYLVQCFVYDIPVDDIFTEKERLQALTREDIMQTAKQYFKQDHLTVQFEEGEPKKDKLPKPDIQPLNPPSDAETEYARAFRQIPTDSVQPVYQNLNEVMIRKLDKHVTLHYTPNPKNDIFSLVLRYGIGTRQQPLLQYAVALMNSAGIAPDTDNQTFRRQLNELGGSLAYGVNDSYMTVQIIGREENLTDICQLVSQQMLMPNLDYKKMDMVRSSYLSSRLYLPQMDEAQQDALLEYVLYGQRSDYIDVIPVSDIRDATITSLTALFVNATNYDLTIHYCGQKPMQEVRALLTGNLPLQQNMQDSESPVLRDRERYSETAVYFFPNHKLQQAKIYFYIEDSLYTKEQDVVREAFNQYFSGGFSGLVLDEIRTKRSMAYIASGTVRKPVIPNRNAMFMGYIGTQSDKVPDAVRTFMNLVNEMPEHPDRIDAIRTQLRQQGISSRPLFRNKSFVYEQWRRYGYGDDPARANEQAINDLTFDRIRDYYRQHVQHKPVAIIIVGDPKYINKKTMSGLGKFNTLSKGHLFNILSEDEF